MAKSKHRNFTNRNQGNMAAFEHNSQLTASPGYPQHTRKRRFGFKITGHDAVTGTHEGHK